MIPIFYRITIDEILAGFADILISQKSCLFFDFPYQANAKCLFGMGNGNRPRPVRVFEVMMTTFGSRQIPTFGFNQLDQFCARQFQIPILIFQIHITSQAIQNNNSNNPK
nr:hypothetical protein [Cellvibrio sp. OA-2007]